MATFTINLFPAEFRREEHAIYDNLQDYLNTFAKDIIAITGFQYIKPINSLTRTIKIPLNQSYYAEGLAYQYTYCSLKNNETGNRMYYYITDIRWIAENTAELSLEFDYMNTYRDYVKFTDNTHITRRFKDRWAKVSATKYKPIIDKYPEELQTPTLHRDVSKDVILTGEKWYLVYYSDNSSIDTATNYPIRCVCYGEKEHFLGKSESSSVTIKAGDLERDVWYHALDDENPIQCTVAKVGEEPWELSSADQNGFDIIFKLNDNHDAINIYKIMFVGTIPTVSAIKEGVYSLEFTNSTFLYAIDSFDWQKRSSSSILSIPASSTSTDYYLPAFSSIYQFIKTQSSISKIIELPTCPFIYEESLGEMTIPTGWTIVTAFNRNALFRTDSMQTLGNYFVDSLDGIVDYKNLAEYDISTNYDLSLETKTYNSNYYQVKYVYDVNSYQLQLEYGYDPVTITFDAANEMSSNVMFKFDSNTPVYSDMGNYICSVRSLEMPIYNSAYLEYQKYGKAIDQKNLALSITGTSTQAAGSSLQSMSSTLVAAEMSKMDDVSKLQFSQLGLGISLAGTAVSLASAISKGVDQLNQKIEANRRTATTSSTTNDLSILNSTVGNQLNRYTYVPDDDIKEAIADFFRIYGYATDEYGQMTCSRYWNDYFVADVEFSKDTLVSNMVKQAVRSRYANGVRIYHWHDKYDLDRKLENWETSIKNG